MIGLIDYNMGNLRSVYNAFEKLGVKIDIVKDGKKLSSYDKIILTGVGAFGDAMKALEKRELKEGILDFASGKKPILGICLGMQLLFDRSYEFGESEGLGLIEGEVVEFDKSKFDERLKVPHMGWNKLFIKKDSRLLRDISDEIYLYFLHTFYVACDEKYVVGESFYGYAFVSVVQKENIFGFQPHPEKSHDNGLKILKNFVEL